MVEHLGFRKLADRFSVGYSDSLAFVRNDAAVFDLRSANVVRNPNGVITPIDSIPVRMDEESLRILSK